MSNAHGLQLPPQLTDEHATITSRAFAASSEEVA
jgi:hypothetical protein